MKQYRYNGLDIVEDNILIWIKKCYELEYCIFDRRWRNLLELRCKFFK